MNPPSSTSLQSSQVSKSAANRKRPPVPDRTRPSTSPTSGLTQSRLRQSVSPLKKTDLNLLLEDNFSVDNLSDPLCPWATGYPWGQTLGNEREYYTRYDKNFLASCAKGRQNHTYQGSSLSLIAKYEPSNYEVGDTHPIHIHLIQFRLLGRQTFDVPGYTAAVYPVLDPTTMGTGP